MFEAPDQKVTWETMPEPLTLPEPEPEAAHVPLMAKQPWVRFMPFVKVEVAPLVTLKVPTERPPVKVEVPTPLTVRSPEKDGDDGSIAEVSPERVPVSVAFSSVTFPS